MKKKLKELLLDLLEGIDLLAAWTTSVEGRLIKLENPTIEWEEAGAKGPEESKTARAMGQNKED